MKLSTLAISTLAEPGEERRSVTDTIALTIATVGGTGFLPIVPATWGSMVGVGIYLIARNASGSFNIWAQEQNFAQVLIESVSVSISLVLLIGLFFVGVWAATRVEKLTGRKDPKEVVIDEIVGQLTVFLFIPANLGWWTVLVGFLAFRLFDIWKLSPADKLESLPSGLGIMADDAAAGIYAAALLSLLCSASLAIF